MLQSNVASLCLKHFNSVVQSSKFKSNEWTVLSCIVMDQDESLQVIAMGTGSKCIGGKKMSKKGDILNDSHAEVICRRAFLRYLYEQMLQDTSYILVFDNIVRRFKLRDGIQFYFFTTHIPCGDATIFPKQCAEEFGSVLFNDVLLPRHLKRENSEQNQTNQTNSEEEIPAKKLCVNDIYRTGAKCLKEDLQDPLLEGSTYHVTGVVRTKPGRGDPTLSVSCSDKIARWSSMGIQGALMSLLLAEPIHFSKFIIAGGTPFDKEASIRAFHGRISSVKLTQPYKLNEMEIYQVSNEFKYAKDNNKVPSPISIIWLSSNTEQNMEISVDGRKQGVTKKNINSDVVRVKICKVELFKQFMEVVKKWDIDLPLSKSEVIGLSYLEVKHLAKDYQRCWAHVKTAFKAWTTKDPLYNKFFAP